MTTYKNFQFEVDKIKNNLVKFLIDRKESGEIVVGYGAAAKGNTLLNYAGIRSDLLSVVFDAATAKQGRYLPGSHIPVRAPNELWDLKPDFVLILPWNLSGEITAEYSGLTKFGTRFVVAVPEIKVV